MSEKQSQERRQYTPESHELWAHLTMSQRLAVTNLNNYGYQLSFIRKTEGNHGLAILTCGDAKATVDLDGEIESDPKINFR
ncbi:MAG: hypothetical protein ACSHW0_15695 [Thalassotalea sp.]